MNRRRFTAYAFMLIVSVIWGVAGPVIKFSLDSFPPLVFLSYRFAISTVIALLYLAVAKPHMPKSGKDQWTIIFYSLCSVTFGLGFLFYGFDKTTSLAGSVLTSTGPLAVIIAGAIFLKEHVTSRERLGVGIAFLGTLVTIVYPLLNGLGVGAMEGNLLILASIVLDTIASILIKVIVRGKISPQFLAHVSFIIGFVTIAPVALYLYRTQDIVALISQAPLSAHLGVWFMAIFSGTIAYTLRNIAVKSIEVSETAVFTYLYPLWAAPLALWWLGETITTPFLVGAGIIAMGVIVAEYKSK